jgi:hypothetical protein
MTLQFWIGYLAGFGAAFLALPTAMAWQSRRLRFLRGCLLDAMGKDFEIAPPGYVETRAQCVAMLYEAGDQLRTQRTIHYPWVQQAGAPRYTDEQVTFSVVYRDALQALQQLKQANRGESADAFLTRLRAAGFIVIYKGVHING